MMSFTRAGEGASAVLSLKWAEENAPGIRDIKRVLKIFSRKHYGL
jgi:hypothetical protein